MKPAQFKTLIETNKEHNYVAISNILDAVMYSLCRKLQLGKRPGFSVAVPASPQRISLSVRAEKNQTSSS
ncbi:hypothetical protein RRG08_058950 [Elysia crispata]|uniref:Uncharacterized protein n=1 Tax=Elysia crispata TaxID=231223 RepID=A0AAE1CKT2_9GAST|nr:hypothetical protein RRG08_058950 [Elysia crispata]